MISAIWLWGRKGFLMKVPIHFTFMLERREPEKDLFGLEKDCFFHFLSY